MTFRVRAGVRDDLEAMVRMQLAMAAETEQLILDERALRHGLSVPFDRPNTADYVVVEDTTTHRVVAMLMLTYEWSDWRDGCIVWVQSVYVLPDYRRQGLFRMLYAHVHDLVQGSSFYQGMRLYVDKSNSTARAAYERMGMQVEHYDMMKWMKSDNDVNKNNGGDSKSCDTHAQ